MFVSVRGLQCPIFYLSHRTLQPLILRNESLSISLSVWSPVLKNYRYFDHIKNYFSFTKVNVKALS